MRKLLNNPWIVTALALAAVAFVGSSLWPKQMRGAAAVAAENTSSDASPVSDQALASGEGAILSVDQALQSLAVKTLPLDPFAGRPKPIAEDTAEQIRSPDTVETVKLSAVWTQEGKTFALINGQVHEAGDSIASITIESASQDGIWVGHWKGRNFVGLGSDFTLVTPAKPVLRTARL
jgi:hypothetical protein